MKSDLTTSLGRRLAQAARATLMVPLVVPLVAILGAGAASAGTGMRQLAVGAGDAPVTVFYPTDEADRPWRVGAMTLPLAEQAPPRRGNGRLVVVSHGSGGSPWPHADLARQLVAAGFVVAMPLHQGDNHRDAGDRGPVTWARRPAELSQAIDAVGRDAALAPLLSLDKVGVYGMSAGGHTALSMAGGRWSPAALTAHCDAHLADDFQTCVGLATSLDGGWADGLKLAVVRWVLRLRFSDAEPRAHHDARVAAVVAAVPLSADFDLASLASPRVPLGLVTAARDRWLVPRFHAERVLAACRPCEHVAHLPDGGHGALLSPLPPGITGLAGDLLNDPPGFDRAQLPAVDRQISAFFSRHLGAGALATSAAPAAPFVARAPGAGLPQRPSAGAVASLPAAAEPSLR